ncbi:hypothetical protein [Gluconobacter kanchanaburiensis]|uniref:Uncharacterized protein n=1 Tax=Gluconobacter kanchanaburiensis NBRC 103587 TaxID=1307948 RepID=A0A511B9E6_9PROT|nr:hypothetical protein [Gluconobacter kanchanaburiensis]MBF0862304.1 hypothetical protein [Gluconobacter kanchanaburiensis]GBR68902.1 hypothetical protein AA103587_1047 [Gluconobacter kanchanaburiensis NBRC 103587]GEK96293.1 hypothetical protein GKA01_14900 [Gluconobacter kanchanaburiensis NBRC 103587]
MSFRTFEAQVLFDGEVDPALALAQFEIDSSRYEACDVASLCFAVRKQGKQNLWFDAEQPERKWVAVKMRDVSGTDPGWTTLFEGWLDHIEYAAENAYLEMECRDALAALMDLRVQDAWLNHTQQELLEIMAQAAGLDARVLLPSDQATLMAGQFWQIEHKRGALMGQHRFQTAADLAFTIARDAFCDLYAKGTSMVCEPLGSSSDVGAKVTDMRRNVLETNIARDLQLLSGVVVHMASWDSRQRSTTHVYYDGVSFYQDAPTGNSVIHTFRIPGRRSEELQRLARGKYARISAHALSVRIRMPGVIGIVPRDFMTVVMGAQEKTLGIDQVISRFSAEKGFVQDVVLRDRGGKA